MGGVTREDCAARDAADPLKEFRARFDLPEGLVYLDGNSLGALPKGVAARIDAVVREEWGRDLIQSWNKHGWIDLPRRAGGKIARLIGAREDEVVCADSTSVNIFKLLAGALAMRPDRRVVVTEPDNFQTDNYVAQGLAELLGGRCELRHASGDAVMDAIDDDIAAVLLTHVHYRTGRMFDMAEVTARAHEAGALMLWDLAHSAGAVPVDLEGCQADLAVGCGYKYLNGGPGAPAFLYVARRHQDALRQPLSGWMGHARPFDFEPAYDPAAGIARNLCGTPPVVSMAGLDAALDVFMDADMGAIREKSLALAELFLELVAQECGGHGFGTEAPPPERRGSQVSLTHEHGYPIVQALIARGVIGDFRAPDLLRFGFAPLYVRYVDVWDAVAGLREVMETRAWDVPEFHARGAVT